MLSLLGLGTFTLLACASKTTDVAPCDQVDWYEIGRRDGAQGAPSERWAEQQKKCSTNISADWETMYANGRNAGLVEYCEPKNAYELGRTKLPYFYVCPSTVEPQFLKAYRKGQASHDLELANQKLDAQISDLNQKLIQSTSTSEQEELKQQLNELKTRRAQNERQLRSSSSRNE